MSIANEDWIEYRNNATKYLEQHSQYATRKAVQDAIDKQISINDMVIFPQTIGDITCYSKQELFDWVITQQKMNKDTDYGRGIY